MPTDDDLERIARQERELQWTSFSEDDAWELGSTLRELAAERQLAIVIDIRRFAPHFGNQAVRKRVRETRCGYGIYFQVNGFKHSVEGCA